MTLRDIRGKKASQARSCRTVTSSVRRLPFEVLSKIFREACLTYPTFNTVKLSLDDYGSLDRTQLPWTLTEVSARWRQVAISNPALWCSIQIAFNWEKNLQLLRLQIHRSNNFLLSVSIRFAQPRLELLMAELLPSTSRWETLCLQDVTMKCFGPIKGNLPALHTLLYASDRLIDAGSTTAFAVTPKLQTLYITLHGLPISRQIMNLFTIDFDTQNPVECLTRFSALEQCSLRLSIATRVEPIDIILPNLRMLELDVDGGDLAEVLDQLTLPALQSNY